MNMKSIKLFRADNTFDLDEFVILEKEYLHQHTITDDAGNTIEEYTYRIDGSLEHLYKYTYDELGRVIEELLIEEDETTGNRTFLYNETGNLLEETIHYLDDSTETITFTYDEQGKPLGRKTMDSDGEEGNYSENKYNDGLLVSEAEYDNNALIVSQRILTYNSENLVCEESIKNEDSSYRIVNEYDISKKLVLRKRYNDENHLIERTTFIYDEKGRLIETNEENTDGIEITKIEYNEAGEVTLQVITDDEENILQVIERTYDSKGRPEIIKVNTQKNSYTGSRHYRLRYFYE